MLYDVLALDTASTAFPSAECDSSEDSIESIFDALHASCASIPNIDSFTPQAVAQVFTHKHSLPSSPLHTVSPATDGLNDLDDAVGTFVADRIASAAQEDNQSGDESKEDDGAADPDFEAISPGTIRPLPGCVFPRAPRAAHLPSPAPFPESGPTSSSMRRRPVRAGRRGNKAAVRTHTNAPAPRPLVSSASYAGVPENYQFLVDMGCTVDGRGMLCNIRGCPQKTGKFADMKRHIVTHYPHRLACQGCPGTFARADSLKRHEEQRGWKHFTEDRVAFMTIFMALPTIKRMRVQCAHDNFSQGRLNKELEAMLKARLADS
ncbi:hypothetical protein B0H13DRAFT_2306680 [Mycena leptocephala]|nr:hypothetical protein B0H13DRAFT_2306680 [Mycena leptocephala]